MNSGDGNGNDQRAMLSAWLPVASFVLLAIGQAVGIVMYLGAQFSEVRLKLATYDVQISTISSEMRSIEGRLNGRATDNRVQIEALQRQQAEQDRAIANSSGQFNVITSQIATITASLQNIERKLEQLQNDRRRSSLD